MDSAPENAMKKRAATPAWRHRTIRVDQRKKSEAKSSKFPADSLRRALRRERRAENRCVTGFSAVSPFYQGQITCSTAK
jgi:hypothetical protein